MPLGEMAEQFLAINGVQGVIRVLSLDGGGAVGGGVHPTWGTLTIAAAAVAKMTPDEKRDAYDAGAVGLMVKSLPLMRDAPWHAKSAVIMALYHTFGRFARPPLGNHVRVRDDDVLPKLLSFLFGDIADADRMALAQALRLCIARSWFVARRASCARLVLLTIELALADHPACLTTCHNHRDYDRCDDVPFFAVQALVRIEHFMRSRARIVQVADLFVKSARIIQEKDGKWEWIMIHSAIARRWQDKDGEWWAPTARTWAEDILVDPKYEEARWALLDAEIAFLRGM